jgi:hypothetical protein
MGFSGLQPFAGLISSSGDRSAFAINLTRVPFVRSSSPAVFVGCFRDGDSWYGWP